MKLVFCLQTKIGGQLGGLVTSSYQAKFKRKNYQLNNSMHTYTFKLYPMI